MSGTTSGVEFAQAGDDTHISIYRGKSLHFTVIWGGATPIDVTGWGALLQIRRPDRTLQLELSSTGGGIAVGGVDGQFVVTATPAETRGVAYVGRWEMELTTPAGDVYRCLSGAVTPIEEIAT